MLLLRTKIFLIQLILFLNNLADYFFGRCFREGKKPLVFILEGLDIVLATISSVIS